MGMIERFIGLGPGVTALGSAAAGMAEIFTENATRRMELEAELQTTSLGQFGHEFSGSGIFDQFINGLNRLPRPCLALGTLALFIYSMVEPEGFARRMEGLNLVPEPLWWLLGAIVGFYFGAREAHYFRKRSPRPTSGTTSATENQPKPPSLAISGTADDFADNAALRDWAAGLGE